MAHLVLGPVLRHVGEHDATVWVETDEPCEVSVLDHSVHTFSAFGHHFALVRVQGLSPGTTHPYELHLDGERHWPPDGHRFPPPSVRTLRTGDHLKLLFGSCRVSRPHEAPFTYPCDQHEHAFERDALYAYALRMCDEAPEDWPDLMFWAGDQVYADELPPDLLRWIRARRHLGHPGPADEAGNFEEYAALYRNAWSDDVTRWFLSTVPNAMIFDDHDVHDDWNTSDVWVRSKHAERWWTPKLRAALASYWIYQHAGNLPPGELEDDEVFCRLGPGDNTQLLEDFAHRAGHGHDGARWSYRRDLGSVRLLVMDSRGGRVLDPGRRAMVDEAEWEWITEQTRGDVDHLLLGTSLPFLLAPALHDLEAWNEAVAGGAWGHGPAKRLGEKIRQGADLEHWAAFQESFVALAGLLRSVARGERGSPPTTVVGLSGDVHHAYLSEVGFPAGTGASSAVYQAVCSPVRNPLATKERRAMRALRRPPVEALTRTMARAAGVAPSPIRWRELAGPYFDNQIARLDIDGRSNVLRIERAGGAAHEEPRLDCVLERELAPS